MSRSAIRTGGSFLPVVGAVVGNLPFPGIGGIIGAAVGTAASAGINAALPLKQQTEASTVETEINTELIRERYVYGETRIRPPMFYLHVSGGDKRKQHALAAFAVSVGECEEITGIYVNGTRVEFSANKIPIGTGVSQSATKFFLPRDALRVVNRGSGTYDGYDLSKGRWLHPRQPSWYDATTAGRYGDPSSDDYNKGKEYGDPDDGDSARLEVFEFFGADGKSAAVNITKSWSAGELEEEGNFQWKDSMKGEDLSFVLVYMRQNNYGDDFADRFWSGFPNIEFVVKGRKITWPGQETPTWTANAAAVRYDIETQMFGFSANDFDDASTRAAIALCEEPLVYTVPDEYAKWRGGSPKTYEINGVIEWGQDIVGTRRDLDKKWLGTLVYQNGKLYPRPGVYQPISAVIPQSDILSFTEEKLDDDASRSYNVVQAALGQDTFNHWIELPGLERRDKQAIAQNPYGDEIEDTGVDRYDNHPIRKLRELNSLILQIRNNLTFSVTVSGGEHDQWWGLKVGDVIGLDARELLGYYPNERFMIEVIRPGEGNTLEFLVRNQRANPYPTTFDLPDWTPRNVNVLTPRAQMSAPNIALEEQFETLEDGSIVQNVAVTSTDTGEYPLVEIRWRVGDGDWNKVFELGFPYTISRAVPGHTYYARARYWTGHPSLGGGGISGPWSGEVSLSLPNRGTTHYGVVPANACPPTATGNIGDFFRAEDGRFWVKGPDPWTGAVSRNHGIVARAMQLTVVRQASNNRYTLIPDDDPIPIPGWAMKTGQAGYWRNNILYDNGRLWQDFSHSTSTNPQNQDLTDELEENAIWVWEVDGNRITIAGGTQPDDTDRYIWTPSGDVLRLWIGSELAAGKKVNILLLDGAKRCSHDPFSPWIPIYGDSDTVQPQPGGFNFFINLANFQTTAAAVNVAGEWHGTGLTDEAWPLSTTITAFISDAEDVQALLNLPIDSLVYLEQNVRQYAEGKIGHITKAGDILTIPITFFADKRHNYANFKQGHNATLDFSLADPNLRNPTDFLNLTRYDTTLNVDGEWNYTLKGTGPLTWDRLGVLKAYVTSGETKSELLRLGADGRAVYITIRDMEAAKDPPAGENKHSWVDAKVAENGIVVNGNVVSITIEDVQEAKGKLPDQTTGNHDLRIGYTRFDYAGMPGFNSLAALGAWNESEASIDANKEWTMTVNGNTNWNRAAWPRTPKLIVRYSAVDGPEQAVLLRNLLRLRENNVIGIRNNADSFAEYLIKSAKEQMDHDYRYNLEIVEGQLRGGPNFTTTSTPTLWFNQQDPVPPLWTVLLALKYGPATPVPPLPGRVGVRFGDNPRVLFQGGKTARTQNMEAGWAESRQSALIERNRIPEAQRTGWTTLWGCWIAISNAWGGTITLSDDWLTLPFKITTTEDTWVLFAPRYKAGGERTTAPSAFPDNQDIPEPYSRILHKLQYEFPGQQIVAFRGDKTAANANAFQTANRVYSSIRGITFPGSEGQDFPRYMLGKAGGVPSAAEFTGSNGYKFNHPLCHIVGKRLSGGTKYAILAGEYEYWLAPASVGPMTALYSGSSSGGIAQFRVDTGLNRVLPENPNNGMGWVLAESEGTFSQRFELIDDLSKDWPSSGKKPLIIWAHNRPFHVFRSYGRHGINVGAQPYSQEVHFKYEDTR